MAEVAVATDEYYRKKMEEAGLYYQEKLIEKSIPLELLQLVSSDIAAKYSIVPIAVENGMLMLATNAEQAFKNKTEIQNILRKPIRLKLADEDNVKAALAHYYNVNTSNYGRKTSKGQTTTTGDSLLKRKIVALLQESADKHVSDIHILPGDEVLGVHFRINGHLVDMTAHYGFRPEEAANVINIIKSMDKSGQTDVSQINMPSQGSFSIVHGQTHIDMRLSTVPVVNAGGQQKVNLRLLWQDNKRVRLEELGYSQEDLQAMRRALLSSASGMFLNSGPTGSGKTTSLYAQIYAVLEMMREPLNVMTIENPVEIRESHFCQVQVRESKNEEVALSAPLILKTGLRQDPDIFLYGEIRDKKDAEVAVEASMTGHKVFSTVHARNCVATIARLLGLDVSRASFLGEINMINSQRLVGILCPKCSQEHKLTKDELAVLSSNERDRLSAVVLKERAPREMYSKCSCDFGYIGRKAVVEYVIFDTALRDAFMDDSIRFGKIQSILEERNFQSMWEKGLGLVERGETDLMEILRTIGKI